MKKVVVYVSANDADRVRSAIGALGSNRLGNYTATVRSSIGAVSAGPAMRVMDEEKIEFACDDDTYAAIVRAIDTIAPYGASVDSWSLEPYL